MSIPTSSRWRLYFCQQHPNAHLVFLDENNQPLLHATITAQQAWELARQIDDRNKRQKQRDWWAW